METGLVPPRRLGSLLADERHRAGRSLEDLAAGSGGRFTPASLHIAEQGHLPLDDQRVEALVRLYGLDPDAVVPERARLVIDLAEGIILMGGESNATLRPRTMNPGDVLPRYLSSVYSLRGLRPGTAIPLRVDDLEVLGRALGVGPTVVEADLRGLMADPAALTARGRRFRRRVLLPAAGVVVAVGAVGALMLLSDADTPEETPTPASTSVPTSVPAVEAMPGAGSAVLGPAISTERPATDAPVADAAVGDAAVQERDASGRPGPVEVRAG